MFIKKPNSLVLKCCLLLIFRITCLTFSQITLGYPACLEEKRCQRWASAPCFVSSQSGVF